MGNETQDGRFVTRLAEGMHILRVVFRNTGFASVASKVNVEQIFRHMFPGAEVTAI